MRLSIEYFSREFYDYDSASNAPRFQQIIDGVNEATAIVGDQYFSGDAFTNQIDQDNPAQQALGVTTSPTVVFVNADSQKAVGKLEGVGITRRRVRELFLYLARLENPTGTDEYVDPNGKPVREEDLFESSTANFPGSFGGLFGGGCPSWMPTMVCEFDPRRIALIAGVILVLLFIYLKRR